MTKKFKPGYEDYETWIEKTFGPFNLIKSISDFIERRKEVFKYSKMSESGKDLGATGRDIGGQNVAKIYFGKDKPNPIKGWKAQEVWKELQDYAEPIKDIISQTGEIGIDVDDLTLDELKTTLQDLERKRDAIKKIRQKTITESRDEHLLNLRQTIRGLTADKIPSFLNTLDEQLKNLSIIQRDTARNILIEKAKIELPQADFFKTRLRTGRILQNLQNEDIRRERGLRTLFEKTPEERQKIKIGQLRAWDMLPTEILTIKNRGELPISLKPLAQRELEALGLTNTWKKPLSLEERT